jgi:lipoprotein-anchoring transpeptidase ErfK/SrfK
MAQALFRAALVALSLTAAQAAEAKVRILVDLGAQRMTVIKNGRETVVWKISSGRNGFETPTGRFIVQRMDADHFSDEYDQAPMPYSIFFSRGLAIHGTEQGGLGRPASHGCVRLSTSHARELYSWVEEHGATIEIAGRVRGRLVAETEPERPERRPRRAARPRRETFGADPDMERYRVY